MKVILDKIYGLLKRTTASTTFIPQIDGLRFLAIWVVVVDHMHGFIREKIPFQYPVPALDYSFLPIYQFFDSNGRKGVLLFFVISGFILGMPFAKHFWQNAKKPSLKAYFLRRLTRLEPPYIVNMVACFFLILFVAGNGFADSFPKTVSGLFPNLASSLVYMHNVIFPYEFSVNPVSWSLEIEVQFYILVPLLVLIFKLSKIWRRLLLGFLIIFFTILQDFYNLPIFTIYSFIQYFLMGFLILDLYLSGFKLQMSKLTNILLGVLLLFTFFYVDTYRTENFYYVFVPNVFLLVLMVMTNDMWSKIFSWKVFTSIGGMCYTIYLWHGLVISGLGNKIIHYNPFHSYPWTPFWHMTIIGAGILGFSTLMYLLIEKPFMDKEWPQKFKNFVKGIFRKGQAVQTVEIKNQ